MPVDALFCRSILATGLYEHVGGNCFACGHNAIIKRPGESIVCLACFLVNKPEDHIDRYFYTWKYHLCLFGPSQAIVAICVNAFLVGHPILNELFNSFTETFGQRAFAARLAYPGNIEQPIATKLIRSSEQAQWYAYCDWIEEHSSIPQWALPFPSYKSIPRMISADL